MNKVKNYIIANYLNPDGTELSELQAQAVADKVIAIGAMSNRECDEIIRYPEYYNTDINLIGK